MRLQSCCFILLTLALSARHAEAGPEVSFGGYLDADVWGDADGNLFTNQELDLGTKLAWSEAVSVNVYATVLAGSIPAGGGRPGDRWAEVLFDGLDLTWQTGAGTLTIGDLVYQYGSFDYYFYKRLSMITPERFTRGVSFLFGGSRLTQTVLVGVADPADEPATYQVRSLSTEVIEVAGSEPASLSNAADIAAATEFTFAETQSLALYYGTRSDIVLPYDKTGSLFAGMEYKGSLGDMLALKADFGYRGIGEGSNTFSVLLEPALSLGDFSIATSYYQFFDPDVTGMNYVGDELYGYIEPGYSFNETVALGLPLEVHTAEETAAEEAMVDRSAFWAVPTLYLYPADGIAWWLWAQAVVPFADNGDNAYGAGSEIIVEF